MKPADNTSMDEKENVQTNFIRNLIDADLASGKHTSVYTRFPPEPNGYLHVGHAKSICLNFGIARDYNGKCNLRFDDTNPDKEEEEYMHSIMEDVRWLGFEWTEERHASDYFDHLYMYAVKLILAGKAYVDSQNAEAIRNTRGTLTEAGKESPYRNRSIEENLGMFQRMKEGESADGEHVLRAKIDIASPNINIRDPVLYRIKRTHHHRTGDNWVIYPMYDFTHCLSDALEGITHSICTLEFEDHRPLYDWVLDEAGAPCHPQQIEFARLQLKYTVTSKRKLHQLVHEHHVDGWDDPRMPTIAGMSRRGYTPASIRDFCNRIGVTKSDNSVEMGVLENCIREDLDATAPRRMAVLRPLKVVITNYPEGGGEGEAGSAAEMLEIPSYPHDVPLEGSRMVPFGREIYIEADDFREAPPKGYRRLSPGDEVRLRYAYFIRCDEVVKDPETGKVVELRCSYDPATKGGDAPDGRKVKGTIHWVSAAHAHTATVRLYDHLFKTEFPDELSPPLPPGEGWGEGKVSNIAILNLFAMWAFGFEIYSCVSLCPLWFNSLLSCMNETRS